MKKALQLNHVLYNSCCSVSMSCPTLWDPMDCSMPDSFVLHYLLEFTQTHVHCISDAICPFHPPLPSSSLALSLSQNQGLFQWVSSSHQVAKVLEFQLQHQSFQWIFRADYLKLSNMKNSVLGDFPDNPVVKTPSSQCRGWRLDPWSN